jgi:uncharacterized protein
MFEKLARLLEEKKLTVLKIKVKTGATKNKIVEVSSDDTIKIEIAAKPENGKANDELMKFLAITLKIKKENIKIIRGQKDRNKLVKINYLFSIKNVARDL